MKTNFSKLALAFSLAMVFLSPNTFAGSGYHLRLDRASSLVATVALDANGDGLFNYLEGVTLTLTSNIAPSDIQFTCYQNGILVLSNYANNLYWSSVDGVTTVTIPRLYSRAYTGGAADCVANAIQWGRNTIIFAQTTFHINP